MATSLLASTWIILESWRGVCRLVGDWRVPSSQPDGFTIGSVVGYALSLSVDDAQIEAAIVLFYTTLSMVLCTVVILIDDDR